MILLFCLAALCRDVEPSNPEKVQVCMSFSVPIESWKDLSEELERHGGSFVLRGWPGDSMEDLILKILELRNAGILAPIAIDPELFERHNITSVPAIIYQNKAVVGNIHIDAALRRIEELP